MFKFENGSEATILGHLTELPLALSDIRFCTIEPVWQCDLTGLLLLKAGKEVQSEFAPQSIHILNF